MDHVQQQHYLRKKNLLRETAIIRQGAEAVVGADMKPSQQITVLAGSLDITHIKGNAEHVK